MTLSATLDRELATELRPLSPRFSSTRSPRFASFSTIQGGEILQTEFYWHRALLAEQVVLLHTIVL